MLKHPYILAGLGAAAFGIAIGYAVREPARYAGAEATVPTFPAQPGDKTPNERVREAFDTLRNHNYGYRSE